MKYCPVVDNKLNFITGISAIDVAKMTDMRYEPKGHYRRVSYQNTPVMAYELVNSEIITNMFGERVVLSPGYLILATLRVEE